MNVWTPKPLTRSGADAARHRFCSGRAFQWRTIPGLNCSGRRAVDNCSKICHGLLAGKSLKGIDVVTELSRICLVEGCFPQRIQCDNGSEFISKEMDLWVYSNGVTLDFSRPGKPTDNPYVESFNGKFRDECLSVNWFLSLDDVRRKIEDFRWEYNHFRPHSTLNDLTPKEFVNLHHETPKTLLSTV